MVHFGEEEVIFGDGMTLAPVKRRSRYALVVLETLGNRLLFVMRS